jgi:hypothetical protein
MNRMTSIAWNVACAALVCVFLTTAAADHAVALPSLAVSSASGVPGATVALNVNLGSNSGVLPASVQWDLSYSASELIPTTGTFYATGAGASGAGKVAQCEVISAGDVRCIIAGIDTTGIGNGTLATLSFRIAAGATGTSTPISLVNTAASDANAHFLSVVGGGNTVVINQPSSQLSCTYQLSTSSASFGSTASSGRVNVTAPTGCSWSVLNNANFLTITGGSSGSGSGTVSYSMAANISVNRAGTLSIGGQTYTVTQAGGQAGAVGSAFYPLTPCTVADTRTLSINGLTGAFGRPFIAGGSTRNFPIPTSTCGVPAIAQAYSLNITVVPHGALGYVTVWPTGSSVPIAATLNSLNGAEVSNAAIVPAGASGSISLFASNDTDVMIDINGYFAPPSGPQALAFYPVTPCRVVDTRAGSGLTGAFGQPSLSGGVTRDFPVPSSNCGIPSSAHAYSVRTTVVARGPLGYLTAGPAEQPLPTVATLNALNGGVIGNQAIVSAGTNGSISLFASNNTDLVIDIDGYFAPPGGPGALYFYPLAPCRVADTRSGTGFSGALGPPSLVGRATRNFPMPTSTCGIPSSAQAYSLNMTAVASNPLGYLTAWPAGHALPVAATLNALNGGVVGSGAIVPGGTSGAISVFASNNTDLVIDINGYFGQ